MNLKYMAVAACTMLAGGVADAQSGIPLLTQTQFTSSGGGGPPPPGVPNHLYEMGDVNQALGLTPAQLSDLNKLSETIADRYKLEYSKTSALPWPYRSKRYDEVTQRSANAWNSGAQKVMDRNQWERYRQLSYQYAGFNSLFDPDVQSRLDLTPKQIQDLNTQRDWYNAELNNIYTVGVADPAKAAQLYKDFGKARQERFDKYLTPHQQKVWNEIAGEPYAFKGPYVP